MQSELSLTSGCDPRPDSNGGGIVRDEPSAPPWKDHAVAIAARLRAVAPYALMELVLPGGSLMAVLLWLYRRRRSAAAFATDEIAALL